MDEALKIEPGADLSHQDLRGQDLRHEVFSGVDLSWADLRGCDLRSANLEKADLSHAQLCGADLRGAKLCYANLSRADLQEVNLAAADLTGTSLVQANLHEAYCEQTKFTRANLSGAYLGFAYLRSASLGGADISNANLTKTDLREAVVIDADFTGVYYEEGPPDLRQIVYNSNTLYAEWLPLPGSAVQIETQEEAAQRIRREQQQQQMEEEFVVFSSALKEITDTSQMILILREHWNAVLWAVRQRIGLKQQAAMRAIRDIAIGNLAEAIVLVFAFGNNNFAREMISSPEVSGRIEEILSEGWGRQVRIVCQAGELALLPTNQK